MTSDGNAFNEAFGDGIGFGFGVSTVESTTCKGGQLSSLGEYGWGGAASTWFVIDPVKDTALVLMTQLLPSSAYPLRAQLRLLYHWVVDEVQDF